MILSAADLAAVAPAGRAFYPALAEAAASFDIVTPLDEAHWLAQMAHESGGFKRVRESLDYSIEGLLKAFGRHRITLGDAEEFGRKPGRPANQREIACRIYGGEFGRKNLGNIEPSDGWMFIGRGLKQLTGRDNYRRCSIAIYADDRLLTAPHLLEQTDGAALSAAWFWKSKNLSPMAVRDDIRAITCAVTGWGGLGAGDAVGFPARCAWLAMLKKKLNLPTT